MTIQEIKKAIECCLKSNCHICPNKEELGSGETVCLGRLLPKIIESIADLEAKLAESEETIKYLKGIKRYDIGEMLTENTKLKQQLAEKDVDLLALDTENYSFKQQIDNLRQQLAEKEKEIEKWKTKWCESEKNSLRLYEQNQNKEQDKISFAIEQLLDIKEEVFGTREMGIIFDIPPVQDAFDVIENKIKQLKEMK